MLAIVGDQFADVNPTPGVGSAGLSGGSNGNGVSGHGKEDSGTSEEVQAPVEKGKKGDDKPSWRSGAVAGAAPSSGKDKDKEKDVKEREEEWPEICGCTISVRQSEDIISIWDRVEDPKVREKIRCVVYLLAYDFRCCTLNLGSGISCHVHEYGHAEIRYAEC